MQRAGLLLVCVTCSISATFSHAAPRTPSADAEVLERLPLRPGDKTAAALRNLRLALALAPSNAGLASSLAQAYFDQAMAKGDPRYVGYAEAVVSPFASHMTADLLLVRGQLRQFRHAFEGALEDFSSALRLDPQLAQAHAWRAAIFLVQANYAAAQQTCQTLRDMAQNALAGACQGLLYAYTGDLQAAQNQLQLALQASTLPDNQLWLHTRLGEVAHWQGHAAQAEQHYQAALALGLDDGYLLAAWSDFLLDAQRPAEVVALLTPWESSDGLLLRLAEAETMLKRPAARTHVLALANRFDAARLRGDVTHRAEEARFELRLRSNPQLSLSLAQANYAVQREPRDARILLEAARAVKNPLAAQEALAWLRSSRFQDPYLLALAQDLSQKTP